MSCYITGEKRREEKRREEKRREEKRREEKRREERGVEYRSSMTESHSECRFVDLPKKLTFTLLPPLSSE
jgi:hypothetical protein